MTDDLLARFLEWASTRNDVRAALLIGSRARSERPADEWSDTDVIVLATEPETLLDDPAWPGELGEVGITFVEPTHAPGVVERRVLFADGRDVDFAIMSAAAAGELAVGGEAVLARGFRVLLDKDGLLEDLATARPAEPHAPDAAAFAETASDFWYHAVWTARKLRRGEVLVAKECLDGHMKRLVIRMAAWHAADRDAWHGARFVEEWADQRVLDALHSAYARYEVDDVERALDATMDLFAWLARETAVRLDASYAAGEEELGRRLVRRALAD